MAAQLFMDGEVFGIESPWLGNIRRAKRLERLPTGLTREEMAAMLTQMSGAIWPMAALLYDACLCLMECVRLHM